MSPEGAEKEKQKHVQTQPKLVGCAYFFVFLFLVWWLFPLAELGFHYLQWRFVGVKDYEIVLNDSNQLSKSNYTEPYDYPLIDEEGVIRGTMPAHLFKSEHEGVNILFEYALIRLLNPLFRCRVFYDMTYGFPDGIHCAQWEYTYVLDFQPKNQ